MCKQLNYLKILFNPIWSIFLITITINAYIQAFHISNRNIRLFDRIKIPPICNSKLSVLRAYTVDNNPNIDSKNSFDDIKQTKNRRRSETTSIEINLNDVEDGYDEDDDDDDDDFEGGLNIKKVSKNDKEWMFFDVAKINVQGGEGGNGCMAMRREFRLEFGGPWYPYLTLPYLTFITLSIPL